MLSTTEPDKTPTRPITSRTPKTRASTPVGRTDFPLWGGQASISVTDRRTLPKAEQITRSFLAKLDAAASTHRADSELARLNKSAGRATRVSPLLATAIHVAIRAASVSEGLVDPTATSASSSHSGPGWRHVMLDKSTGTVVLGEGLTLDLGATAKAWAADQCAARVVAELGGGALISLLGDVSSAGNPPESGWLVEVGEYHRSEAGDDHDCAVTIRAGGLATSSTAFRQVTFTGVGPAASPRTVVAHSATKRPTTAHIVDPLTHRPVRSVWRSVTIAANTCLGANTASTAAIVLGSRTSNWGVTVDHPTDAVKWLETRGHPARLVDQSGEVSYVGAWPR